MEWSVLQGELIWHILAQIKRNDPESVLDVLHKTSLLNHHWYKHVHSSPLFVWEEWLRRFSITTAKDLSDTGLWTRVLYPCIVKDDQQSYRQLMESLNHSLPSLFPTFDQYQAALRSMAEEGAVSMLDWTWKCASEEERSHTVFRLAFYTTEFMLHISNAAVLSWYLDTLPLTSRDLCRVHGAVMLQCCLHVQQVSIVKSRETDLLRKLVTELPFPLTAHQSLCVYLMHGIHQSKAQRRATLFTLCSSVLYAQGLQPLCTDIVPNISHVVGFVNTNRDILPFHPAGYPPKERWTQKSHGARIQYYFELDMLTPLLPIPETQELLLDALQAHGYYTHWWCARSLVAGCIHFYDRCYSRRITHWLFWLLFCILPYSLMLYYYLYCTASYYCYSPFTFNWFVCLSVIFTYLCLSFTLYFFWARPMERIQYSQWIIANFFE